jgi:hypothetical protein
MNFGSYSRFSKTRSIYRMLVLHVKLEPYEDSQTWCLRMTKDVFLGLKQNPWVLNSCGSCSAGCHAWLPDESLFTVESEGAINEEIVSLLYSWLQGVQIGFVGKIVSHPDFVSGVASLEVCTCIVFVGPWQWFWSVV